MTHQKRKVPYMKKTLSLLLALCALVSLSACGAGSVVGKANDFLAARQVDDMIADLPDTVTLEDEDAIVAAENAYNALSDEQKAQVEYAGYLPIYRNNLDILKQEAAQKAAFESLSERLVGTWINLYDPEDIAVEIHADGTAKIVEYEYEWTLNQNLETIRFEGNSRIVFAVEDHDGLLVLHNPELMTCIRQEEYQRFAADAVVKVSIDAGNVRDYFGDVTVLGALEDAEGKDTGARLFAFHSKAYDDGLVFFTQSPDFALEYAAGRKLHGAVYEPYSAYYCTDAKQVSSLAVTNAKGELSFIRSEFVSSVRYDAETLQRVITLTNGIELRTESGMNPTYKGASFNGYDFLADPSFVF